MNQPAQKKKSAAATPKSAEAATINQNDEWARIQADWARVQVEKLHAKADRFFTADEDIPLHQHILLLSITAFFAFFIVWANFATLDEVTRGQGRVIPSSEIQKLQSLEGGIIDEFMVKEGEEVTAGQILVRLRDVQATSELGANQKRVLGLKAKIARLQAEAEVKSAPDFSEDVMKGVPDSVTEELNTFRANRQNLQNQLMVTEQQLAQRKQEISELRGRVSDVRGVIALARQEMETIRPLVERGSAPKLELLQKEREIKERQTELNSLESSAPRIQATIEEAEARIKEVKSSFAAQAQTELAATQIELNSLGETLGALQDRKTRTEIKSPVNGYVKEITVNTVGGVVQPGMDIIEIVPKDDQLLVEAQIRPADIAFLHPGQGAMVKITAYDFSIYGGLKGEVIDISADSITNEEGESFYRVRVRTFEASLKRKGEVLPIIPGMVASVDILTGKKTVMEYILKPIIKTINESMGER
ncbi:MAG: HlyD family type I secretion periplasmic adaptor subunit [Micavibrio aeruginosavorus]|uniref:HlyD family type I secretion periplasmic adaptor subunit n=1 Tax=Micavibrio aeruginosavorus TaxID=349221 RepID=A0A7T5R2E5_9BACT|nr:MAG: HlyD family type I secretion periplasmic adaptor subunit [Micavibrio aeruginosavorus]